MSPDGASYAIVTFTWYNRSVGVTGTIWANNGNPLAQIQFQFLANNTQVGPIQTRSTSSSKGFDFIQDASNIRGGITDVNVYMCSEVTGALACTATPTPVERPPA